MREEQEAYQETPQVSKKGAGLSAMPSWLRWSLTVILFLSIVICLLLYVAYVKDPAHAASPGELGLSGLLIFCVTALAIIHIPWHELGYRITKVGAVEFEQALNAQVAERAEEIGYLEERIAVLESALEKKSIQGSEMFRQMYAPQLRKLLLDFLSTNDRVSFSPSRIKEWGSTQQGFESLKNFEVGFIRHILGKMVAERVLETVISKKGNTLYRIAE
jgi:hypothetical protein